jgi:flagellar M-ring protein FliF
VVGRKNIRAQVTAELDFSQSESTTEAYKPNQMPDSSSVRSQQTLESTLAANQPPTGVPGAATNQPPGPSGAQINGAAQTPVAAGAASAATGARRESIINYEVDKTVRVVRGATGMIKRISAAVVINHQNVTDPKGKTSAVPISDEQLTKMTALVRETIGFNKDRGDSVNLMNAAFTDDKANVVDIPWWERPEVLDMVRALAWPLGTLLLAALVLLGAVRPALKAMTQPLLEPVSEAESDGHLDALESEEPDRPLLEGPGQGSSSLPAPPTPAELALEEARKLTRDNPAAVANIVKAWINGEAPS